MRPPTSAGGGGRPEGLPTGNYVSPTVFVDVAPDARIFQEEIFGPVVSVTPFNDFDDAIKIANDTLYGLGAGVWTRDANTAYRAGRAIQAGRVWTRESIMGPRGAMLVFYRSADW